MQKGFTFIELLISLTILAAVLIPMMQLFSHAMEAAHTSRDLITASALASREMERIKNLSLGKEEIRQMGDTTWPPVGQPPFELNKTNWRIERRLTPDSDPLEISVMVHREDNPAPVVQLVTLIEDMTWGTKS